jgi:hypothetical protein
MAELVDALDLKFSGQKWPYGFDSHSSYKFLFFSCREKVLYLYIIKVLLFKKKTNGEVAEWSNAPVLKTGDRESDP